MSSAHPDLQRPPSAQNPDGRWRCISGGCFVLLQRTGHTPLVGGIAVGRGNIRRAPGGERLLGSALGDDFGLLVFHVSSFRGCCLICFFFAAVAGTRRHPTAKWIVVCALSARASLSDCRDTPCPSSSSRTKCTCCRFRAGGFPPVRMGIRARTCSTRTNRNGLRRPCAHAIRSAHTGIRVRSCSIRNVCILYPSFVPLAVVSRPDTVSTPPFTPILAPLPQIFHLDPTFSSRGPLNMM